MPFADLSSGNFVLSTRLIRRYLCMTRLHGRADMLQWARVLQSVAATSPALLRNE
jgi:hypothetical protein